MIKINCNLQGGFWTCQVEIDKSGWNNLVFLCCLAPLFSTDNEIFSRASIFIGAAWVH